MPRYIDVDQLHPDMTVFLSVYSETPVKVYSQEYIDKIPTADVCLEKHGKWNTGYFHDRVCSCCLHPDNDLNDYAHNYCPNCGAKMDMNGEFYEP